MDVAVESPVNTQPPPLLFGGESPNASLHLRSTPQSPIQAAPFPDQLPVIPPPSNQQTLDPSSEVQMEEAPDTRPTSEENAESQVVEPASETEPAAAETADDPMDTTPGADQAANQGESQSPPQNPIPPSEPTAETNAAPSPEQENLNTLANLPNADGGDEAGPDAATNAEQDGNSQDSQENNTEGQDSQQNTTSDETQPDAATATATATATANEGEAEMADPPPTTSEEIQTSEESTEITTPEEPVEEGPSWAGLADDTSAPDEEEMKEIESSSSRPATDFEHWESSFYDDLEDPDHVPIEKTRITWILKGLRGTKKQPMEDLILKSPKALVGGHYWGFKFFPRGNNNEDLSIYIDCSNEPEKNESKSVKTVQFRCLKGPPDADLSKTEPSVNILAPKEEPAVGKDTAEPKDETMKEDNPESSDGGESSGQAEPEKTENANPDSQESSSEETQQEQTEDKANKEWRVSAQIGLVCYNPDEPRTRYHQTSYHMFTGENSDWGWTRFHGPWEKIHTRRRGQVKPLMQNDTIAMDAYIRIIKDDTKSLWWHSSEGEPYWPSMTLHGLRGLGSPDNGTTPLVTTITPWIFLAPFRKIMYNVKMPSGSRYDDVPKYLCGAMRKVIYLLREQKKSLHYVDVGTAGLVRVMKDYAEKSSDVVSCWESLRRMLEIELKGSDAIEALSDIFDGRLDGDRLAYEREHTLKANKNWISAGKEPTLRVPAEGMKTVQEALEKTFAEKSGPWALPKLLQVELDRQKFDKQTRKWQKIMDKVHLNEEVDLSKWTRNPEQGKYTLYGFIVHQGERTSGRFYSVLRPTGPGGKWFSFRETNDNKIACLTSKEVKAAAEGPGPESVKATKPPGDVPYIALYVRSDVVSDFLKPELERWEAPRSFRSAVLDYMPEGTKVEDDPEDYSRVTCEIYNSDIFKDRVGRGVVDVWDPELKTTFPGKILTLDFPSEMKVSYLRWKLYKLLGLKKEEQVRLWPMIQLPPAKFAKNFNPPLAWAYLDTALDFFRTTKLRIWMHILPPEHVPVLGIPEPPIPIPIPEIPAEPEPEPEQPQTDETQQENSGEESQAQADEGAQNPSDEAPAQETTNEDSNDAAPTEPATDATAQLAEAEANPQPSETETEAEMADAPAQQEQIDSSEPTAAPQAAEQLATTPAEPEVNAATEPAQPEANSQTEAPESGQPDDAASATASGEAEEPMPDAPPVAMSEQVEAEPPTQTESAAEAVAEMAAPTTEVSSEVTSDAPAAPEASTEEPAMDTTEDPPSPSQEAVVDVGVTADSVDQPPVTPATIEDAATQPTEAPAVSTESSDRLAETAAVDETPAANDTDETPVDPQAAADEDADLQEALRRSIADAEAQQTASADTEMQDAQAENATREAAETTTAETAETAVPEPEPEPEEPIIKQNGCYVFVQRYDPFEQKLTAVGSFVAKGEANIKETVRKYLEMPEDADFLVWETRDSYTTKSINTGQSFYDAEISDGNILIVRNSVKGNECVYEYPSPRILSANRNPSTKTLESKADFPTPQDHLRYLAAKARAHPILSKTHPSLTSSTYGTPFYSGAIKRGHFHGNGTLISDNGDQYTGPFVLGDRSGNGGHLITACGDEYTGSFYQNQRHGEGTFVEQKTGNKYVGGWQQDKRHGKGVTYWEVADEEMNTCQICYGAEQDALFYDCGHVCACTTCARQVDVCPICRASVKGVVRIYRT
jgi:hypothetical protein